LIGTTQSINLLQHTKDEDVNVDAIPDMDTLDAMAFTENAIASDDQ